MASHFGERRDGSPCLVRPLPQGMKVGCYEDAGLRYADVDRYGNPLTHTTSAELRALRVTEEMAQWNRAIIAFILALRPEDRIVVLWC